MNLLGNILKSSQRGTPRPWYSHRYTGRLLLLCIAIFIYEYYTHTKARSFDDILLSKTLKVAYLKAPDVAYESTYHTLGLQYEVLTTFSEQHGLEIELQQATKQDAIAALNNNQYDLLIGHFEQQSGQASNPFSQQINSSNFKALLTTRDLKKDAAAVSNKDETGPSQVKTVSMTNWRPYQETVPWHTSTAVIVEHKEPKTPKTQKLTEQDIIYYASGFPAHLPAFEQLNLQPIGSESLLDSIANNEVQYGIAVSSQLRITQKFVPRLRRIKQFKQPIPLVWLLAKHADDDFSAALNTFLSRPDTQVLINKKAQHWRKKYRYINYLDLVNITNKISSTLPKLQTIFQAAGTEENIEWTLLAALAFQESQWDLNAVSPTQVRGVMQLTKSTAETLGVVNRTDPEESIHAAARYIKRLEKIIPVRVKRSDRIWLAVASYNLGIGRIMQAYRSVRAEQEGEISWPDISQQLIMDSTLYWNNQYSTGARAVEYVERIREFQQIMRYYAAK